MKRFKAIIPYTEIVQRERAMLQRGMNFRLHPTYSVILMSVRKSAPYNDRWHDDIGLLEYEGHDEPRRVGVDPKQVDQPMRFPSGALTENGKFFEAAATFKDGRGSAEIVQVYEKISQGIWSDRGRFELVDAKIMSDSQRRVFRFFLRPLAARPEVEPILRHSRIIPTAVKVAVWQRDGGQCVLCGSNKNLHFDHDVPYSRGGSSITANNVRLLCARHNLEKSDKIESILPWIIGITSILASRTA